MRVEHYFCLVLGTCTVKNFQLVLKDFSTFIQFPKSQITQHIKFNSGALLKKSKEKKMSSFIYIKKRLRVETDTFSRLFKRITV